MMADYWTDYPIEEFGDAPPMTDALIERLDHAADDALTNENWDDLDGVERLLREASQSLKARDLSIARWQRNSRDSFEAMVAMRNDINEHIPLPSLESDLLNGPEDSVFCSVVAESVIAALKAKDAEIERMREALTELVDSLDAVDAEAVRAEKAGEPGWSSAPAVHALYARESARKALGGSDGE